MELQVKINQILPIERREYTKKDGTTAEFISRGFCLGNGVDNFYCEATGEQALQDTSHLSLDEWRTARIACSFRPFSDKDGKTRFIVSLELKGLTGMNYR